MRPARRLGLVPVRPVGGMAGLAGGGEDVSGESFFSAWGRAKSPVTSRYLGLSQHHAQYPL